MRPRASLVRRPRPHQRLRRFWVEALEDRRLLTGGTVTVPLDPTLDQFGDQVITVQAYGDASKAAFGLFDTGASAVTFSPDDAATFADAGSAIPVKNPGGAAASGIGGDVTGDVSQPGTILADGLHAAALSFDADGFPLFNINFAPDTASTPGIQAFIGTAGGSPDLPTITGTPVLSKSPGNPDGLAALIDMQGEKLDFSDIAPGLVLAMPDVHFTTPTATLSAEAGTTDPVKIALTPYGGDNYANPGDLITETPNETIQGVSDVSASATLAKQSFLVDTGAQLSVISTAAAQALGLDLAHPETSITVQGVAGSEDIPGYTLKELDVPTADGGTLRFTNIPVYVLDVADGIDGILGMNAFNTASKVLFNPNDPSGALLSVTYFTNPDRSGGDLGGEFGALLAKHTTFGNTLHGHSMPGFTANVTKASASETVTPTVASPVFGQPESFAVSMPVKATGTVTLYDGATRIESTILSGGKAVLPANGLATGAHSFTVTYSGDAHFNPARSAPLTLNVARAGSSVALAAFPAHAVVGQPVVFSATASPVAPGAGAPGGAFVFLDGSTVIGVVPAVNGHAAIATTFTTASSHAVTAVYTGDVHFTMSFTRAAEPVDQAATFTALSSATITAKVGNKLVTSYQLTIVVGPLAPGAGQPTGPVVLNVGGVNQVVSLKNGVGIVLLPSSVKGKPVFAVYVGDGAFRWSRSNTVVPGGPGK
jgi:hypothetical protein